MAPSLLMISFIQHLFVRKKTSIYVTESADISEPEFFYGTDINLCYQLLLLIVATFILKYCT